MSTYLLCTFCKRSIFSFDKKFYCCQINDICCGTCYGRTCSRCHGKFTTQLPIARCQQCYLVSKPLADLIYQPKCKCYYCDTCISKKLSNTTQQLITLKCGHNFSKDHINKSFQNKICYICKKFQQSKLIIDLSNGKKCCQYCYIHQKQRIQPFLLTCMSCGASYRKIIDFSPSNQGLLICSLCAQQSQTFQQVCKNQHQSKKIQQKQPIKIVKQQIPSSSSSFQKILQIKKIPQQKKIYQHKQLKSQKSSNKLIDKQNQLKNNTSNKIQNQFNNLKLQDTSIASTNVTQPHTIPKSPTHLDSQTCLKTPTKSPKIVFPQQNQLSNKKSPQYKSQNKTILNNFPQKQQQQLSQQPNQPSHRIKKHLSMDTYIQKMQLNIEKSNINLVTCNDCQYDIEEQQSFEMENYQKKIKKYCKLCYTTLTNSQVFGFAIQSPLINNYMDASRNLRGASNQKNKPPQPNKNGNTFHNSYQFPYDKLGQQKYNYINVNINNKQYDIPSRQSQYISKPTDYNVRQSQRINNTINYIKKDNEILPKQSITSTNNTQTSQKQYGSYQTNNNHIKITPSIIQTTKKPYEKQCFICKRITSSTILSEGQNKCLECFNSRSYKKK